MASKTGLAEILQDFLHAEGKAIDKQCKPGSLPGSEEERHMELINLCREVYRRTNRKFEELGLAQEDGQGRTHYLNLVTAHISMATGASMAIMASNHHLPEVPLNDPASEIAEEFWLIRSSVLTLLPPWLLTGFMADTKRNIEMMKSREHVITST